MRNIETLEKPTSPTIEPPKEHSTHERNDQGAASQQEPKDQHRVDDSKPPSQQSFFDKIKPKSREKEANPANEKKACPFPLDDVLNCDYTDLDLSSLLNQPRQLQATQSIDDKDDSK